MASPIVQDIIFKVGSTGAGAATSKMKGLSAGMIAGKVAIIGAAIAINKLRQHLNTLTSQYARLDETQKEAVQNMRKVTQGMISVGTAMKASGALATAGIKDQKVALEAIAKAAYEQGARFGEDSKQIQSRIESLTKILVEGRVTGLREYGISLKRTGDLATDQVAAINALRDATEDINVSYENMDDAIEAVGKGMESYLLSLYSVTSESTKGANIFNVFKDVIGSVALALNNAADTANNYHDDIKALRDAGATQGVIDDFKTWTSALERNKDMLADGEGDREKLLVYVTDLKERLDDLQQSAKNINADLWANPDFYNVEVIKSVMEGGDAVPAKEIKKKKPSRGGGGGRRKEKQPETIDDILGIKKPEPIDSGFDTDIYDSGFDQTPAEIAKQKADEYEAALKLDERNKVLADFRLQQTNAELDDYGHKLNLKQDYIDKITSMDIDANEKHQMLQDEAAKVELEQKQLLYNGIGESASQLFKGIAALQQVEGKKAFEIGKVAAIADTTIQGAMGAVKAYQSMVSIPYVGPVLGAAAAAGVLTYTGVQVAKISKQKYNGGGNTSSSSASKVSTGGLGSSDYNTSNTSNSGKVIENTIILDGNILHQSILTVNDNANQQGQRSFGVVEG